MAQEVEVDFGSFSISSYLDKNFVLVVSTSVLISVPAECSTIVTATELRDRVQNGSLWIARAGSCHIELSIGFGGSLNDGSREDLQRMCVEAFEDFPVWDALGLNVRREYNQFNEHRGCRSLYPYSVQHKQHNSGLIAPSQVPCAYLTLLTCNFTFGSKSTLADMVQSTPIAELRDTKVGSLRITPCNLQDIAAAKKHQSGTTDQPTPFLRKSKIVTLNAPPSELRRIFGVPEICSLPLGLQETRLTHLTHAALHLVFGSRKRISGIQILKKPGSPTALEVAPAVWSSRYFQDVVARAQLTSFVSSGLGSLMSTGSKTFQNHIQSLGCDPVQEIYRRTLLLVLRSARVPRIQVQVQWSGCQPEVVVDAVIEDDGIHELNESQEDLQEQELPGTRQSDQPHDGTLFDVEAEVYAHHFSPDLAHEDASTYENRSETNEELGLGYKMTYSSCDSPASQSISEDFGEPHGFDNEQLLSSGDVQNRSAYWMQGSNDQELQDALMVDAMDEEYTQNSMEEPVGMARRNFGHGLYDNRDNRHDSMSDTQRYGIDVDPGHQHQTCLDTELEEDPHPNYRPPSYEVEDFEQWEDGNGYSKCWSEQNLRMESGGLLSSHGEQRSQIGYEDNRMDVRYNTDNLDYAMNQSFGEAEHVCQHEDLSMHSNDGLTDEDTAVMITGQQEFDENESILDEPHGEDAREGNCDGHEAEVGIPSKGAFKLHGNQTSWSSSYHHRTLDGATDGRYLGVRGTPGQPC